MIRNLIDAVSAAISMEKAYGIFFAIIAFIVVFLYPIRKRYDENKARELSEEEQRNIEIRNDNIQFIGMLIGIPLAIGISIWMIILFIKDH